MKRAGFTLLEMTIAVAVTAFLLVTVSAATASLARSASASSLESRTESECARLIQILTSDWRSRVRVLPLEKDGEILRLATASDSFGAPQLRTAREVRYFQTDDGLVREESGSRLSLPGRIFRVEFWSGTTWSPKPTGKETSLRLSSDVPFGIVVVR